jgi:hypothetical protein
MKNEEKKIKNLLLMSPLELVQRHLYLSFILKERETLGMERNNDLWEELKMIDDILEGRFFQKYRRKIKKFMGSKKLKTMKKTEKNAQSSKFKTI